MLTIIIFIILLKIFQTNLNSSPRGGGSSLDQGKLQINVLLFDSFSMFGFCPLLLEMLGGHLPG